MQLVDLMCSLVLSRSCFFASICFRTRMYIMHRKGNGKGMQSEN